LSEVIEKSQFGLQTLTATHQTVSVLEALSSVIDLIADQSLFPKGKQELLPLLHLSLLGIDINDIPKTNATIKIYYSKF